jgi:hypothetical protein
MGKKLKNLVKDSTEKIFWRNPSEWVVGSKGILTDVCIESNLYK